MRMFDDFVNLQGQERGSRDDSQVLGPAFLEPEPDAFDKKQRAVREGQSADYLQSGVADQARFLKQRGQITIARIDSHRLGQVFQCQANIAMQQSQQTERQQDQQTALDELENG